VSTILTMNTLLQRTVVILAALSLLLGSAACKDEKPPEDAPGPVGKELKLLYRTADVAGCYLATPLLVESQGNKQLFTVSNRGVIRGVALATGEVSWSIALDVPDGHYADMTSTPALVDRPEGALAVVTYQLTRDNGQRMRHGVIVVDIEARALHPGFPEVTLEASKPDADGTGTVVFDAGHAFSRATIPHGRTADSTLGFAYVSFGNIQDIQPWHGWMFELNLDAWLAGGAEKAVTGVLLTTPETYCPVEERSGSRDQICGGGIWAPAGPKIYPMGDTFEILVPTGNGQLDLGRRDYANTLMRMGPGLNFEDGCDKTLCADWNVDTESPECAASCKDLFIPRLKTGDPPLAPESGVCNGRGFFACYAALDWDLGANAPEKVSIPDGPDVYILPGKDGAVYVIDANHMGTMHDRLHIIEACGTPNDPCKNDWAGMIINEPTITTVDGAVVVLVPTFQFDKTHPAGLVAMDLTMVDSKPKLSLRWTAPNFETPEAIAAFRMFPGRAVLTTIAGEEHAIVVEASEHRDARVYTVRVRDGEITDIRVMDGKGQRYVRPTVHDGVVYVTTCDGQPKVTHIEAYSFGTTQ
jgi:hypothetical protein